MKKYTPRYFLEQSNYKSSGACSKLFYPLIIFSIFFISCSTAKTIYHDGNRATETGIVSCTKPAKTYSPAVESATQTAFNNLKDVATKDLDSTVERTVKDLAKYEDEGLDIDLVYYHSCVFVNNIKATKQEKEQIIKRTLESWKQATD